MAVWFSCSLFLFFIVVVSCSIKTETIYAKKLKTDPPFCYEFSKVISEDTIECSEKQVICDENIKLTEPISVTGKTCTDDHRFAKYVDWKWNEILKSKV